MSSFAEGLKNDDALRDLRVASQHESTVFDVWRVVRAGVHTEVKPKKSQYSFTYTLRRPPVVGLSVSNVSQVIRLLQKPGKVVVS